MADRTSSFFLIALLLSVILSDTVIANTPEIAKESYDIAKQKIELMQEQGYPTLPLMDILSDAQRTFNNGNYNYSDQLSKQVLIEAQSIIELQEQLVSLTDQMQMLSSFGVDMTSLEIKLLYTKSDYEAASVNLAREQAEEISKEVRKISSNHSKGLYLELKEYKASLDAANDTNPLFEGYYSEMEKDYRGSYFSSFLEGYGDFKIIKGIIEEGKVYHENMGVIKARNISFERAEDMFLAISGQISLKQYGEALDGYHELNDIAELAIGLDGRIDKAQSEMQRLDELGILDDQTRELYGSVLRENDLENFEDSKTYIDDLEDKLMALEKDNLIFQSFNKAKLKKGMRDFFAENWLTISLVLLFVLMTFNFFKNSFLLYHHERSVINDGAEIEVLISLQKSLQEHYFIDKTIDKKDYDSDFQDYEDRKVDLGNSISLSRLKLHDLESYFAKLEKRLSWVPFISDMNLKRFYAVSSISSDGALESSKKDISVNTVTRVNPVNPVNPVK